MDPSEISNVNQLQAIVPKYHIQIQTQPDQDYQRMYTLFEKYYWMNSKAIKKARELDKEFKMTMKSLV